MAAVGWPIRRNYGSFTAKPSYMRETDYGMADQQATSTYSFNIYVIRSTGVTSIGTAIGAQNYPQLVNKSINNGPA
jgi:hypothetical protein